MADLAPLTPARATMASLRLYSRMTMMFVAPDLEDVYGDIVGVPDGMRATYPIFRYMRNDYTPSYPPPIRPPF